MAEHDIVLLILYFYYGCKIKTVLVKTIMTTALKGLKVLDFSTLLPGPFATLYLADLGAEVIHIESPTRPDLVRLFPPYANGQATSHSYLNRNKQSVTLDLKDPASIEQVKQKISEFDIVVEQFRPGVMQRLGLDYQTLAEINPRLIYCSITGYGQTGSYKDKAGHDINYIALSGIAGHCGRQDSGPPPMGIQIADVAGGSLHAVIGILAAVVERQNSGLGQYIDIPPHNRSWKYQYIALVHFDCAPPQPPKYQSPHVTNRLPHRQSESPMAVARSVPAHYVP